MHRASFFTWRHRGVNWLTVMVAAFVDTLAGAVEVKRKSGAAVENRSATTTM